MSEPDPRVTFGVRDLESTTSTKPRTTNPKWNETHYFFINSPENERLACKIQDEKSKSLIATLDFSIAELLNEPNLSTDRSFNLTCLQAGYLPKLHMKLSLKVIFQSSVYNFTRSFSYLRSQIFRYYIRTKTMNLNLKHSPATRHCLRCQNTSSLNKSHFYRPAIRERPTVKTTIRQQRCPTDLALIKLVDP